MYEQVFKLHIRPFTSTPYVKHYFAAQSIHKALSQCHVCVEMGSGPVVVVGNSGTGKSLLLNLLAEQFQDRFRVIHLSCARLEKRHELLQSMLFSLNQPYREMSEVELRLALIDYLKPKGDCPQGVLMLVDEAHRLSCDLLDELRLITNIVDHGQPQVRMVMAGGCQFEENLTNPKLESLNQRIAARCFLANLVRDETTAYVIDHIYRAGGDGEKIFSPGALDYIHDTSAGCPRVINQLCDHAMLLAAGLQLEHVDKDLVQEAWSDIQCLPEPMEIGSDDPMVLAPVDSMIPENPTSDVNSESCSVLEFGELSDDGFSMNPTDQQQENYAPLEKAADELAKEDAVVELEVGFSSASSLELMSEVSQGAVQETEPLGFADVKVPKPHFNSPQIGEDVGRCDSDPEMRLSEAASWESDLDATCAPDSVEDLNLIDTPYADGFTEDALLEGTRALNVAEQNIKSLEVTQDHVNILEVLGEEESLEGSSVCDASQIQYPATPTVGEQVDNRTSSLSDIDPHQQFHVFTGLADDVSIDSQSVTDWESESMVENLSDDELRLTEDELQELKSVASAVERMERYHGESIETFDNARPASVEVSQEMAVLNQQNVSEQQDELDMSSLSEAEMLIEQIRRFTDQESDDREVSGNVGVAGKLNNVVDGVNEDLPISSNLGCETHQTDHRIPDDRDMLVVNRSEQLNMNAAAVDPPNNHLEDCPSTGHAKRMDYHDLFEQLRSH